VCTRLSGLEYEPVADCYEYGNELSGSSKIGNFLHCLGFGWLPKKDLLHS
jgi:hypothetical protein